ncbi:MAG: hypothetical protein KW806_00215 [Candidatus Yanofskybacteria bacterium]|nr:hypothetical protein [Candidatus Yanofskybacteria bacterium]
MSIIEKIKTRSMIIGSLFQFLWSYKLWWMIPMIILLLLFFLILILGQSTPLGPFIYTIF